MRPPPAAGTRAPHSKCACGGRAGEGRPAWRLPPSPCPAPGGHIPGRGDGRVLRSQPRSRAMSAASRPGREPLLTVPAPPAARRPARPLLRVAV